MYFFCMQQKWLVMQTEKICTLLKMKISLFVHGSRQKEKWYISCHYENEKKLLNQCSLSILRSNYAKHVSLFSYIYVERKSHISLFPLLTWKQTTKTYQQNGKWQKKNLQNLKGISALNSISVMHLIFPVVLLLHTRMILKSLTIHIVLTLLLNKKHNQGGGDTQ